MRVDVLGLVMPIILGFVFLGYGWLNSRLITGGQPLTPHMKRVLRYGFFFVLGAGYAAFIGKLLNWPISGWVLLIIGWGVLLAFIAWRRYRRARAASEAPRKPISTTLAEGLPAAGLLVCLVASVVEWSLWADGKAHLAVALLWTAGVPAMIALARRNRRATVIVALRAFLALGVIGAIGRPGVRALVAVGVIAVVLFLVEKLWKKEPAMLHIEGPDSPLPKPEEPASAHKSH